MEQPKIQLADEIAKVIFRMEHPIVCRHRLVKRYFQGRSLENATEAEKADLVQTLRTDASYLKLEIESLNREVMKLKHELNDRED